MVDGDSVVFSSFEGGVGVVIVFVGGNDGARSVAIGDG